MKKENKEDKFKNITKTTISPSTQRNLLKDGTTFLLTISSIIIIFTFFQIKNNSTWFNDRILAYWNDFQNNDDMSIQYREQAKLGSIYTVTMQIANSLPQKLKDTSLILLPPIKYFTQKKIDYHVPEPIVFYYYSGIKTIWAVSKDAPKATHYLAFENGKFVVKQFMNKDEIKTIIQEFNKNMYDL